MLDINLIRKDPELVKRGLAAKKAEPALVDDFLRLDEDWRELTKKTDDLKARQKTLSEQRKIAEAKINKEKIKEFEAELKALEKQREEILNRLPNLPDSSWPVGKDETENKILKEVGQKTVFDFPVKDYLTLGKNLGIIDVERAAQVAGSRFGYLLGGAALLELALVQFAFKKLTAKGFQAVIPPVMIRPEVFRSMGRLAGGQEEERYFLPKDELYLIGSAEHTLGPIHQNEVLAEKDLPRRYVGFSTCFRREAGSYGKDTKGILRVHQFDKVEMFVFAKPENSAEEQRFLLSLQEELMQELSLPYQVVQVCTGDLGWTDAAQYDIETWLPGQNKYRETHSCSNTTDFQARGVNVRYKTPQGNEFVHMLNATGLAIGRTLIAIIENYQTAAGQVAVPKVLQPLCGFKILR